MKDYVGNIDTSLLQNEVINPAWPGHDNQPISNIQKIIVHHEAQTAEPVYEDTPRYEAEANYQATSIPGSKGLAYHYKIDNVGQIMQTRELTTFTWHAANLDVNEHSIAICLDGNFEDQEPTREQFEALKQLLDNLCTEHPEFPAVQSDVYGHTEVSQQGTSCPGKNMIGFVQTYRNTIGNVGIPDVGYQHPELQPQAPVQEPVIPPAPVAEPVKEEIPMEPITTPTPEVAPEVVSEVTPPTAPAPAPVEVTHVADKVPATSPSIHPKVTAAAIAGAITTVIMTALSLVGVNLDPGVTAAITTLIAFAAGYLTSTN